MPTPSLARSFKLLTTRSSTVYRIFFLTTLLVAGGCRAQPDDLPPEPPLQIGVSGRMNGYSLARAREYYAARFAVLLFEGLARVDSAGTVQPSLATRWDTLDGGRRFRFHLRRNVRFHDGTPFGSADVVRAWQLALQRTQSNHPWMLDAIDGADASARTDVALRGLTAVDDSTLDVRLTTPLLQFPRLLISPEAFIGARTSNDSVAVGTGPWQWRDGAANADSIRLSRFGGYWGVQPRMGALTVRVVDDTLMSRAIERRIVDCTSDLTRESMIALSARTDVRIIRRSPLGLVRLVLNLRTPVLSDLRVRRALALALDRARLASDASASPARVANGPLPPDVAGSDKRYAGIPYDPTAARELLTSAGFAAGLPRPLRLRLPSASTVEFSSDLRSLLTTYWAAGGIAVEVSTDRAAPVDLELRVSYPDTRDADDYLYSRFHSTVAGEAGNTGEFRDTVVDRLLDSGRVVVDSIRRQQLMRAASVRIDSLVPNIFLWYVPVTTASHVRMAGCDAGLPSSTFVNAVRTHDTPPR